MLVLVDEAIILEREALLLKDSADVRAQLWQRQPTDIVGRADDTGLFQPAAARVDLLAGFTVALLGAAGHAGAEGAEGDQREGDEAGIGAPGLQRRHQHIWI